MESDNCRSLSAPNVVRLRRKKKEVNKPSLSQNKSDFLRLIIIHVLFAFIRCFFYISHKLFHSLIVSSSRKKRISTKYNKRLKHKRVDLICSAPVMINHNCIQLLNTVSDMVGCGFNDIHKYPAAAFTAKMEQV